VTGAGASVWRRVERVPWAYWALLLCAGASLAVNVFGFVVTLPLLDAAGHSDTYVLHDARGYAQSGRLYRTPADAPYNPSVYSPLFYLVLSLPFRLSDPANPFLAPRLIVGGFFALCVLVSMSIAGALARHRSIVLWSGLLGLSVRLFGSWLPQLKVDFMAALFGLISVRLLMIEARWAAPVAGLAAGTAVAFRMTNVAAALSGLAWLVMGRRYRSAAEFMAGSLVTGAGGYLLFVPFEPHLSGHLFALGSPLRDYPGLGWVVFRVIREPVVLLAVSALLLLLRRPRRKWQLLLLYGASSALAASAAALHPGVSVNHFFEAVLIAVPLASLAAVRLTRTAALGPVPQIVLAALIVTFFVKPTIGDVRRTLAMDVAARNGEWVGLQHLVKDRRVFAVVPPVDFLTGTPLITEPFVLRVLELGGAFDSGPLADRIRAREFELVVTRPPDVTFRGVELLSPSLWQAIRSAYAPFCVLRGRLYHLPDDQRDPGSLGAGFLALGCIPSAISRGHP
jgi:hypothetical protein